jgi:hypothetical protein
MKILIKFPSRSRPDKFFKAVENIQNNVSDDNYLICATLDQNDRLMNTPDNLVKLSKIKNIAVNWGHSKGKIHAVNRDVPKTEWDILVLFSDDMQIITKGFDNLIREDFNNAGTLDSVIYYSDGYSKNIVSFPVIGRAWYERYNFIYHTAYMSLFCDEELYIVAERQNKLYKSKFDIVKHNHPSWTGAKRDRQLIYTESLYKIDKRIFEIRKSNNFKA